MTSRNRDQIYTSWAKINRECMCRISSYASGKSAKAWKISGKRIQKIQVALPVATHREQNKGIMAFVAPLSLSATAKITIWKTRCKCYCCKRLKTDTDFKTSFPRSFTIKTYCRRKRNRQAVCTRPNATIGHISPNTSCQKEIILFFQKYTSN